MEERHGTDMEQTEQYAAIPCAPHQLSDNRQQRATAVATVKGREERGT